MSGFYISDNPTDSGGGGGNQPMLQNRVLVQSSSDLAGTLSSSVEYFIDGFIDMTGVVPEIPAGGITLRGYSFDLSKLICDDDNYTLFTSPAGGSGNVLGFDIDIQVTGANSKVFDLISATGFNAIEMIRVNYTNCTSLGVIDGYRQGLESGTGRLGGTPDLTLKNGWLGGYRISESIAFNIQDGMAGALFKAGTDFVMQSRFLCDMNMDIGSTAALIDFAPANFPNPSTLLLNSMTVSRNGVVDSEDATITPNIDPSNLSCDWRNNQGIKNTFVGGRLDITAEATTTMGAIGTFVDLAGTWTASDLEHFDTPANGQLRNLGNNPIEYTITGDVILESQSNRILTLRVLKFDSKSSSFVSAGTQARQVSNLQGGRDVAIMSPFFRVDLNQNDYIKLQVSSNGTQSVTAEISSFFSLVKR